MMQAMIFELYVKEQLYEFLIPPNKNNSCFATMKTVNRSEPGIYSSRWPLILGYDSAFLEFSREYCHKY